MIAPWLSPGLFRSFTSGTRPAEGEPPPRKDRRRPPSVRPRLDVEVLEGRLCPSFMTVNITDPSQLPLQLPGSFSRGQEIQFIIIAATNDATENTEGEAGYLTLTSSTGDLNRQVNLGQTLLFDYRVIQRGETFTLNSSDGDEIGTIVYAVPQGPGKPGSAQHPFLVTSDFWNYQKLLMMDKLQTYVKDGLTYDDVAPTDLSDNPYFHDQFNRASFTFQDGSFGGNTLTGHEVNYYFQGMVAAEYELPEGALKAIVRTYYVAAHHRLPPDNVLLAATQGFENYQADHQYWQQQTHQGTQPLPPMPLPTPDMVDP
jgi:hypothetical protein